MDENVMNHAPVSWIVPIVVSSNKHKLNAAIKECQTSEQQLYGKCTHLLLHLYWLLQDLQILTQPSNTELIGKSFNT